MATMTKKGKVSSFNMKQVKNNAQRTVWEYTATLDKKSDQEISSSYSGKIVMDKLKRTVNIYTGASNRRIYSNAGTASASTTTHRAGELIASKAKVSSKSIRQVL